MDRALTTAATGLNAQQANIERIANDLANANTDGYKRTRNEFKDLLYESVKEPGEITGSGSVSPVGVQKGMGVKVGASHKIWEQGPSRMTYNPYDLMIEGPGFFPLQTAQGEVVYTRVGAFHRNANGQVITAAGDFLIPNITVPNNAVNMTVSAQGEVKVDLPGQGEVTLAQIQLINFPNPEGLNPIGAGRFRISAASGAPLQALPGENGMGLLQQGALEGSNVNVANSMVDMISTQRAYEMGTRVMKVADQMMEATVNLK